MTGKKSGTPRDASGLKALIASAPLEGVDLTRHYELGRENTGTDNVEPITSELDYGRALAAIETYFGHEPDRNTSAALPFNELAKQISAYEDKFDDQAKTSE